MRIRSLLFVFVIVCVPVAPATAISWSVQMNCANDYYAYCSKHVAGSAGCHACMNSNRLKLTSACVSALIDDGIIPKTTVAQSRARIVALNPRGTQRAVKTIARTRNAAKTRLAKIAFAKRSASPPDQAPAQTVLKIDQQTFEALKNRAPYFVRSAEETASIATPD